LKLNFRKDKTIKNKSGCHYLVACVGGGILYRRTEGQEAVVLGRFRESIPDDLILLAIFTGERED
jgi:hypothetical protein